MIDLVLWQNMEMTDVLMDEYIRNFKINKIQTNIVNDLNEYEKDSKNNLNQTIRIYQMNIRSANKNLDELKITLEEANSDFDLIILTETWEIRDTSLFNIQGYNLIYNEGLYNQNDGVLMHLQASSTSINLFTTDLSNYLRTVNKTCNLHIIAGDINIDIMEESNDNLEYLNILSEHNYISTINEYTRVIITEDREKNPA
ncbi:hypothetical protein NQ317_006112 [Molorchus minor]|uniref:Endonuclease/exonuclease/phosphatase domain-containing protein n=1 Tax=Molorchus minor TaxID=1323400 RepID=A0ABQ9JKX4_9CUCU|nr:hypothetical protein NQ317_006112 [Molorchus minor]